MRLIRASAIGSDHPDYPIIQRVESVLLDRAGGYERLRLEVPRIIRRAIDEVIDTPRTKRLKLSHLEKTEKTYIGTKIEILLRDFLGLPKGLLDLRIDGLDVDVKNTLGINWMIPDEAQGKPCILVRSSEITVRCFLGIVVARPEYLTVGVNKDNKRSISAAGFAHIHWILHDCPYPPNFWEEIPSEVAHHIMLGKSGNERIIRLFRSFLGQIIHRDVIHGVARQLDYMKRVRKNGGARDTLAREGVALLSGKYDSSVIARLGLGQVGLDEFVAYSPVDSDTRSYLLRLGCIR